MLDQPSRTRVLVPSGALALTYEAEALARGIAAGPDIIAIDGGSTDSGPAYLGRGVSKYSRTQTKADWRVLMQARAEAGVPLVVGSAGTCGADAAVDWMVDITREIAAEEGMAVRIAVLKSGQMPDEVARAFEAGRVTPLPGAPEVGPGDIRDCTNIVALAGAEQITAALETGADIVIAGRTTDTAIIAALPIARGGHAGAAWHGAKIGECGALCASNPQTGVILVDFDDAGFTVTPLGTGAVATPHTVSAHMLYENSDPFVLHEPGGHLDVTGARYDQSSKTAVRVTGSQWVSAPDYRVKLEGARVAGYQSVTLALLRDRRYVGNATQWARDIEDRVRRKAEAAGHEAGIEVRLIGKDASFGQLETRRSEAVELGALGIVTAASETACGEIAKMLDPYLLHHPLTAQEEQPTFAFPFSPAAMPRGAAYEFVLHHVMQLDDPMSAFHLEVIEIAAPVAP